MSQVQSAVINKQPLEVWRGLSSRQLPERELLQEALQSVHQCIAPVWPLKDYVAVNPYHGITDRSFLNVRKYLRIFSDSETLMPLTHYAAAFRAGQFELSDIESALAELQAENLVAESLPSAAQLVACLGALESVTAEPDTPDKTPRKRQMRAFSEILDAQTGGDWTQTIGDELSKFCAQHYDQGEAAWKSPWQHLSLFDNWRSAAQHDRSMEIMGVSCFRQLVQQLPDSAETTLAVMLEELKVPRALWETYLLCQACQTPGWSAWAKYQFEQGTSEELDSSDLTALLAIRLVYEVALSEAKSFEFDWSKLAGATPVRFKVPFDSEEQVIERYILLRASEIAYRNKLLNCLRDNVSNCGQSTEQKLAQMVFCIDVRSERIRRQLEQTSAAIETLGFAGFFGIPMEYIRWGDQGGDNQLPVLLQPQFQVTEELPKKDQGQQELLLEQQGGNRSFRKLWKRFQQSAVGSFPFVETMGLFYGLLLGKRAWGTRVHAGMESKGSHSQHRKPVPRPSLNGLDAQGITVEKLTEMAETILKNMSLTTGFAQLVVFCGHESQTANNPLKAGLDCGACGGHSGASNAQVAAEIMNLAAVRRGLKRKGIEIPEDTVFIAGVHNTTTDQIRFFEPDQLSASHREQLDSLQQLTLQATHLTRAERMTSLNSESVSELLQRAGDWSEVRPEWGLSNNAALVVGPRQLTRAVDLDGRTFLHNYDPDQDPEGTVLENIMTAPMIVAHWINMQYYASTVDQRYCGSGNKTVHNVTGGFGILSGNGGDLMTGLPWQSLHDGQNLQHQPQRLQVVINASRQAIENVIARHTLVANLLQGSWLYLIACEAGEFYQYRAGNQWKHLDRAE
ncbi:MAG: DUF2309 domain-containing protein [Gimesia sp.]|nr:DUF2309 domain-containing protein [Gimesia sp.]